VLIYLHNSWFKKIVYHTNHISVERALLGRENVQQTVRLVLMNAFKHSDHELTELMHSLFADCPSLFEALLPRSEQESLKQNDEADSMMRLPEDALHKRPAAIGRIQPKYCKEVLKLPMYDRQMSDQFKSGLRKAYADDYRLPNIYHFGHTAIQWCKKLAFTDP
jgi:hypothetical protein